MGLGPGGRDQERTRRVLGTGRCLSNSPPLSNYQTIPQKRLQTQEETPRKRGDIMYMLCR